MPNFHGFHEFRNSRNSPGSHIFQNFQNPNGKNLDLQVKMPFAKKLPQGMQILQRQIFKFIKNNIFRLCNASLSKFTRMRDYNINDLFRA